MNKKIKFLEKENQRYKEHNKENEEKIKTEQKLTFNDNLEKNFQLKESILNFNENLNHEKKKFREMIEEKFYKEENLKIQIDDLKIKMNTLIRENDRLNLIFKEKFKNFDIYEEIELKFEKIIGENEELKEEIQIQKKQNTNDNFWKKKYQYLESVMNSVFNESRTALTKK